MMQGIKISDNAEDPEELKNDLTEWRDGRAGFQKISASVSANRGERRDNRTPRQDTAQEIGE